MTEKIVTDNTAEQRCEIPVDGDLAGYAVYERSPGDGTIAFVHTVVETSLRGAGHRLSASQRRARRGSYRG